jgi:acyl carrier protein
VEIVLSIESALGIQFSEDEITGIADTKALKSLAEAHLAA